MINVTESNCCGCGLCAEVCPVNAIEMNIDECGFLYLKINMDKCIGCNKCEKVCSFVEEYTIHETKKPIGQYIARTTNDEILQHSSSGGLFSELSDWIIKQNGSIYGAGFDSKQNVIHKRAINIEQRNSLRGSKYVQSNLESIYNQIESDLKEERYVLFTGTPCQNAAIYSYCKEKKLNIDKLFLCDVICHGVSSPLVWKYYIQFIKDKYLNDTDIKSVNFRDKSYGFGYNMCVKSENTVYHKNGIEDPFIKIFSMNYAMRLSCNNCHFKKMDRVSDITIGDFQNEKKYFPEYDDGKGISVVLINTIKGKEIFNNIKNKLEYKECTLDQATQVNLYKQVQKSEKRQRFFDDVNKKPFDMVLKKYTEYGIVNHAYGTTRRFVRDIVYSILGRE